MRKNGEYTASVYQRRFGSWNDAVRQAGYEPNREDEVSRAKLLSEIKRLARSNRPPTEEEIDKESKYSVSTYYKNFSSLNDAIRKAGYDPNYRSTVSESELLEEIRRLASNGHPPTQEKIKKQSQFAVTTYYNNFETWNNAVQEAVGEINEKWSIPQSDILDDISTVAGEDSIVGRSDYKKRGEFSVRTVAGAFGSWWQGVVQAGLTPSVRNPLSPEEFSQYFDAATEQNDADVRFLAHMLQFTGIPVEVLSSLTSEWIAHQSNDIFIQIPADYLQTRYDWPVRLPQNWMDTHKNTRRPTHLHSFVEWYFDSADSVDREHQACRQVVRENASDAGLDRTVTPDDLRTTLGVHMTAQGAPVERVQQHLGVEECDWPGGAVNFQLWIDSHSEWQTDA